MNYYYDVRIGDSFDNTKKRVVEALSNEGFGILTEINVKDTFKEKLDVDFRNYIILGACNPSFAHKALKAEDKIGTLLPCNVIIQESDDGFTEVAAVDPAESMRMVGNPDVAEIAGLIKMKLENALNSIK